MKYKQTLQKVFESNYCKLVFLLFLILGFIITPQKIFYSWYWILGIIFAFVFALTMTCLTRNIKDKINLVKKTNSSIISIFSIILGISAFHMCTIGAPVCGAAGIGLLSLILPSIAYTFFYDFSLYIAIFSILLQLFALYSMGCLSFYCIKHKT